MRQAYVFEHWILTLLISPIIYQVLEYTFGGQSFEGWEMLEAYPLFLLLGLLFSSPTFFVCLTCFYFLSKNNVKWATVKIILILVAIIGVNVTMAIIKGTMSRDIVIAYSTTTLIVGLLLNMKNANTNTQESLYTKQ